MKRAGGDFAAAWGGIASLELLLPAVWDGARAHGVSIEQASRLLAEAPARIAGLASRKGRLAPGLDADLVAWDPEAVTPVEPERLQQRHKLTPYAGRRLRGRVRLTMLRGSVLWRDGPLADSVAANDAAREEPAGGSLISSCQGRWVRR
jgi:allantoinase